MTAYYNEIDPYAAQWLRNLIAAGHIAPGVVDTRSITELDPDELKSYTQCHFFAGIGVWSHALRAAGWDDARPVWTGSCPCQPFSSAGKRLGTADERHLWPAFARLIAECKPATVFGEQVASRAGRDWLAVVRADLEGMGYAVGAADLCAAGTGAPHIRQRLYWVADAGEQGSFSTPQRELHSCEKSRGPWHVEPERLGANGGLADASQARWGHSRTLGNLASSQRQESSPRNQSALSSDDSRAAGGLADADNARQQGDGLQPLQRGGAGIGEIAGTAGLGAVGGLADADGGRQQGGGEQHGRPQRPEQPAPQRHDAGGCREGSGMADAVQSGWAEGRTIAGSGQAASGSGSSGLADADHQGLEGRSGVQERADQCPAGQGGLEGGPSAPDGFWAAPDWLWCRDGRWRPVESGTFPLVTGASARVGRLRAYGNAIVPQVAEAFVRAYLAK